MICTSRLTCYSVQALQLSTDVVGDLLDLRDCRNTWPSVTCYPIYSCPAGAGPIGYQTSKRAAIPEPGVFGFLKPKPKTTSTKKASTSTTQKATYIKTASIPQPAPTTPSTVIYGPVPISSQTCSGSDVECTYGPPGPGAVQLGTFCSLRIGKVYKYYSHGGIDCFFPRYNCNALQNSNPID